MIKDAWFQTVLGGATIEGQVWIKYDWFGSLLKTIMRFYWCLPNFLKSPVSKNIVFLEKNSKDTTSQS